MALTATYEPTLSRIRLSADALGAGATYAVFDRGGAGLNPDLVHSFEGNEDGTAVTVANSAKQGQNAFVSVTGNVFTDADAAIVGGVGLRAELISSQQSFVRWRPPDGAAAHFFRAYIRTPAVNGINSRLILRGSPGSTLDGWDIREVVATDLIGFATRNTLRFTLGVDGGTAPLTPNTVYRIEARVVTGGAGTAEVRLYDAAGVLLDSDTFAGAIDAIPSLGTVEYGLGNGVDANQPYLLDGIGYSSQDWLGPWQDPNTTTTETVTVRGGSHVDVVAQAAAVDDYEFPAGVQTTYRVRSFNAADVLQTTYTTTVTQDLDDVWVKVVARPFLNAPVVIAGRGEVTRTARNGVFAVVGRSFPVAVSDVRGSRQFALRILTETAAQRRDFDLVLASGEPIFLHTPLGESKVDDGYFTVGDTTETPTGRISQRRVFELPLTEIAAPGSGVVGAAGTWQTVLNAYATWQEVIDAHPTWAGLLELVGDPTEVIVS